jgi:hypothetical protein
VPEGPSPLREATEVLEKTAITLQEVFERLRRKLMPVTLSVPESKPDAKVQASCPRSEFVGQLDGTVDRLGVVIAEMEVLLRHLEV